MYLAQMQNLSASRQQLRTFGGLNETYGCSEAEYAAGKNFSSRDYPALSTRLLRRKLEDAEGLRGLHHLDGLLLARGTDLIYRPDDPEKETVELEGALLDGEKQMASMGTKILIFPDKKIFDTRKGTLTDMGASWSPGEGAAVRFTPCDLDGVTYTPDGVGTSLPSSPADGYLYLLAAEGEEKYSASSVLQKYSKAMKSWSTVNLDYCRIEAEGIGGDFVQWDTVSLGGVCAAIREGIAEDLDGDKVLSLLEKGAAVVPITKSEDSPRFYGTWTQTDGAAAWESADGKESWEEETEEADPETEAETDPEAGEDETEEPAEEAEGLKLERRVPDLEYVTECDNRVWGCNSEENVIYACKLGDPTNWYSYRGIASDSYAVTVGSDGAFTGAATCMGYVIFFKENTMHKIFGSKPADYQTTTLQCRGAAKGAAGSLCVINETLFYLSRDGVMIWDGSLPGKISGSLSRDSMANAVSAAAGTLDGRYYLSVWQAAGARAANARTGRMLVYDTERGVWHEEDGGAVAMASTGRQLYLWDGASLWAADPSREPDWPAAEGMEEAVDFDWQSGQIGLDTPEDKYLSRVSVRLDAAGKTSVSFWVQYDWEDWQKLDEKTLTGKGGRVDLAFVPRRHDLFRLRITGRGQITLRTLALTLAAAKGRIMEGAL